MRTRSEAKRREIVRVAAKAFEELGFERTSMLTIAERMGGSKQTLYNYFPSKEDLLRAVLHAGVEEAALIATTEFTEGARIDLRTGLVRCGVAYLAHALSPARIALVRTVANAPAEMKLGREYYENAIEPAWRNLAKLFEGLIDNGKLDCADPWLAALQFKALNELDLYERVFLGACAAPGTKELERNAVSAADALIALYGANGDGETDRDCTDG